MKKSNLRYIVLLFFVFFILMNYSCKKSTTSSVNGETFYYPQINIKVVDTDIPNGTGSYDFGEVNVGETSTASTFTIENLGDATLNLDGTPIVGLSGTDSGMFSVVQQPNTAINVGATTTTSLTFNPTTEGYKTATVTISNDDSDNNPYIFTLDGMGIIPFILDYVGNWNGQWTNTTFNSTGAAHLEVTADTEQKTVQFVIDVDGNVLGGSDPDPITLGGTYNDAGITIESTINTFGDLTLTIDAEGNINGTAVNVPNQYIEKIDFNGTATPETITINYTVTFTADAGGGTAAGIFTLNKV